MELSPLPVVDRAVKAVIFVVVVVMLSIDVWIARRTHIVPWDAVIMPIGLLLALPNFSTLKVKRPELYKRLNVFIIACLVLGFAATLFRGAFS